MTSNHNAINNDSQTQNLLERWNRIPLYVRILIPMVAGLATGMLLGEQAIMVYLPSQMILRLLGALAPPLILCGVAHVTLTTDILCARRAGFLMLRQTVRGSGPGISCAKHVTPLR